MVGSPTGSENCFIVPLLMHPPGAALVALGEAEVRGPRYLTVDCQIHPKFLRDNPRFETPQPRVNTYN
jgi:hypothetical protein